MRQNVTYEMDSWIFSFRMKKVIRKLLFIFYF